MSKSGQSPVEVCMPQGSSGAEGQEAHSEPTQSTSSADAEETGPELSPAKAPEINPKGRPEQPAIITNKSLALQQDKFPPINENVMKECDECHSDFLRSYLYRNFAVHICDDCRDPKGAHELITRTDAKSKYLLKDCDLDLREPPLRYILKKNPYHSRGDMRLYLKFQVEERALLVHGSEEQLEQEIEKREERKTVKKQKVYDKRMKSLSMQVRSSLYKRTTGTHEHKYGEPIVVDEDNDLYKKICETCGHVLEYEEM